MDIAPNALHDPQPVKMGFDILQSDSRLPGHQLWSGFVTVWFVHWGQNDKYYMNVGQGTNNPNRDYRNQCCALWRCSRVIIWTVGGPYLVMWKFIAANSSGGFAILKLMVQAELGWVQKFCQLEWSARKQSAITRFYKLKGRNNLWRWMQFIGCGDGYYFDNRMLMRWALLYSWKGSRMDVGL